MQHYYNLGTLRDDVAPRHAQRPALRFPEETFTYARLSEAADALALRLLAEGCDQGDVIALAHTKRPLAYALMLACLRLGMPYAVLDVASPLARSAKILATARPRLLLYDDAAYADSMRELAAGHGCPSLLLDDSLCLPLSASDIATVRQRTRQVDGATLAYIMFTSGSTGAPKGVAVTHQNVLHFIQWGVERFRIVPDDIYANVSPMYFDNSVFDFYTALFSGASLAPVPHELLRQPYALVDFVRAMGCTIWFSVPSLLIYLMAMKALQAGPLPSLRSISFGGEGFPKPELKKLYDLFSGQAVLVNVYGPTECTCICSAHTITQADFANMEGLPSLGALNQNFDHFIEDENGRHGTEGELVLIGPNVAAGYFNDPERTAAAFTTIPEPSRYMKRAYRTGDLVREQDGLLHFLGRKDNQIKHMGYRIELEEIESALMQLPGVRQAAAVYHRPQAAYGKIIAFAAHEGDGNERDLLRRLGELLPAYMVPSRLTLMASLPKNANGKVDRRALKASLDQPPPSPPSSESA